MESHEVKESPCPICHVMMDMASDIVGHGPPRVGDFTVCAECGAWLRFGEELALRLATDEEISQLPRAMIVVLAEMGIACDVSKRRQ